MVAPVITSPAPQPAAGRPAEGDRWSAAARGVASVLIALYLAAVILPPLAGPPPASALAGRLLQPLRPLVGGLALGHGYRFFAPNPGPGHALRWTIRLPDGSARSGTIPDRDADRPRLLYHRRFMIPEKLAALVPAADAPADVRRESKGEWQPLVEDIAAHLLARHGGVTVELSLVEHYLPTPEESIRGEQGTDAVTPLGTYMTTDAARAAVVGVAPDAAGAVR
jgi:hypothetical protein